MGFENRENSFLDRPMDRGQFIRRGIRVAAGLGALGIVGAKSYSARAGVDENSMDPTATPGPEDTQTPTPTEQPIEVQPTPTNPEQQIKEFPYAHPLSEVKVTVAPAANGFRTITSQLTNPNGPDTTLTLNFSAVKTSDTRTSSIDHEELQKRSAEALTIYAAMIAANGSSREQANFSTVMEAQTHNTEVRQPRTSNNDPLLSQRMYEQSFDDPDFPGIPAALLQWRTAVFPTSSSNPSLKNFVENYLEFHDNGIMGLGPDGQFGNDVFWHRVIISVTMAQAANALRAEKLATQQLIDSKGFNTTAGADGVDGTILAAAATDLGPRLASVFKVLESNIKTFKDRQNQPDFNDPTGEMARLISQWDSRDTTGRILLSGNIIGKSDLMISSSDISKAASLIITD